MKSQEEKIKVLHIITRFICGGADENTLFTVNGLDKSKYDVHLMIGNTFEEKMIERLSSQVRLIKIMEMGREISPLNDLIAIKKIYDIIKKEKYDIVHTHTSKAGFIGRMAAKIAGTKHIIHGVHTIPFADVLQPQYNSLFLLLERFVAGFTDVFLSVGEDLKARYIKAGVGKNDRYHVVYSGMDIAEFDRALMMKSDQKKAVREEIGVKENEICVGIVSRLEPGKGYNLFPGIVLKVVKQVSDVKFVVVGDGSLRESLIKEIRENHLEQNVSFVGFRDDVANVMAVFDLAIFTSLLEGLPRTVVQYAILKRPIVTFDVGGVHEVVKDGENGFIVEMNDVDRFADKVIQLLKDPGLREKICGNENGFPGHIWSKDEMNRRIDEIYQRLPW